MVEYIANIKKNQKYLFQKLIWNSFEGAGRNISSEQIKTNEIKEKITNIYVFSVFNYYNDNL